MKIAVWVPLGMDVLSTLTFGRSDAQVLISRAFCVQFYVRFEEIEASSQWYIIAHSIQATIQLKNKPPGKPAHCKELADAALYKSSLVPVLKTPQKHQIHQFPMICNPCRSIK